MEDSELNGNPLPIFIHVVPPFIVLKRWTPLKAASVQTEGSETDPT